MKVLFVVHGFPPETTAGTEVVTLSLAKALARRGHEVVVVHRVADPSRANYSVDDGTLDDLRVIRVTNHLRFRSIGETYRCPEVEARFREILDREKPDVVHFEHLIHLSATLVSMCREKGVPSVVTLNDYWFRCPRVQLIRSDGSVCSGPPPILGCAVCVGRMPRLVSLLAILSRPFRRALASLASRYLDLGRRNPDLFRGVLSDVAYIAKRPGTLTGELLGADFVIAPSRFLKGKAVEAGLPAGRLVVSDYGMETDWLHGYRRTEEKGRVRFGFIGSLVPHKGARGAGVSFQRLDDPRAAPCTATPRHCRCSGRRGARGGQVTRGGLSFHRRYRPRDVGRVLGSIDVLVVPSVWYPSAHRSPSTRPSSRRCRVGVQPRRYGPVAEDRGGLRFRAGDDADLARVMRRFLDEEDLARKLVAAPKVKSVDENAAEMEVKYRQAIGLRAAHSLFLEVAPEAFRAARGNVVVQEGRALLLLPVPGGSSAVYEFATDGAVTVELRLSLLHFAGEQDVVQGGEIRLDGRVVLRIGPTAGGDCERVETRSAPVRLGKGRHRIEVRNRVRGPGGGTWTARLLGLPSPDARAAARKVRRDPRDSPRPPLPGRVDRRPELERTPPPRAVLRLAREARLPRQDRADPRRQRIDGRVGRVHGEALPRREGDPSRDEPGVLRRREPRGQGGLGRGRRLPQQRHAGRARVAHGAAAADRRRRGVLHIVPDSVLGRDARELRRRRDELSRHRHPGRDGRREPLPPQPKDTLSPAAARWRSDKTRSSTRERSTRTSSPTTRTSPRLEAVGSGRDRPLRALVAGLPPSSATSRRVDVHRIRLLQIRNPLLTIFKNYDDENLKKALPAALLVTLRRTKYLLHLDEREYRMEGNRGMALGPLRLRGRGRTARLRARRFRWPASRTSAINDFLTMLPRLVEKRRGFQARRRRQDAKIAPLFLDPFLVVESPPEYSELQGELLRFLGLDRVFEGDDVTFGIRVGTG
jgi:glycosyltransferase involved in cell wall biosynthesis